MPLRPLEQPENKGDFLGFELDAVGSTFKGGASIEHGTVLAPESRVKLLRIKFRKE